MGKAHQSRPEKFGFTSLRISVVEISGSVSDYPPGREPQRDAEVMDGASLANRQSGSRQDWGIPDGKLRIPISNLSRRPMERWPSTTESLDARSSPSGRG